MSVYDATNEFVTQALAAGQDLFAAVLLWVGGLKIQYRQLCQRLLICLRQYQQHVTLETALRLLPGQIANQQAFVLLPHQRSAIVYITLECARAGGGWCVGHGVTWRSSAVSQVGV